MEIIFKNKKYLSNDKIWNCIKKFIKIYLEKNDSDIQLESQKKFNFYSSIIDVGCGNGKNMKYLQDNKFINVHGCDIDDKLIKLCKFKVN
jgi:2-polyprenyl-3-methyl-5-hydroxy-6-metoxy-1,4-benzoquinol methylase